LNAGLALLHPTPCIQRPRDYERSSGWMKRIPEFNSPSAGAISADCPDRPLDSHESIGEATEGQEDRIMSTSKPDNADRKARILDLTRKGKTQAEIARELGMSRGVASGVIRRAHDAGILAKAAPPKAEQASQPDAAPSNGGEEE
jgi:DNA-binding CsgD family transcriptional regulator